MTLLADNLRSYTIDHADPAQTAACVARVAAANALEFELDALGTLRARSAARNASFSAEAAVTGVRVQEYDPGNGRAVCMYRPDGGTALSDMALVYFHGGGFVTGSLAAVDYQCRMLCREAGITVASFAYALAPEHPFPAAIEDALGAIAWIRERLRGHDGRTPRIIVAGDSAGGNLAAVASQSLARFPLYNVVGQVLVYPVLDLHNESWSYVEHATTPTLTAERMRWYASQYVRSGSRTDPRMSPLLSADLTGVAPALIISAEIDPLVGEAEAYASALSRRAIDVERHTFSGLYHGFWNWGVHHDAVQHACGIVVDWLRRIAARESG